VEQKTPEQMTVAEVCDVLNQKRREVARPHAGVHVTTTGHRVQATPQGYKPVSRSKEKERRRRQAERRATNAAKRAGRAPASKGGR
jgi:hypothetical protein